MFGPGLFHRFKASPLGDPQYSIQSPHTLTCHIFKKELFLSLPSHIAQAGALLGTNGFSLKENQTHFLVSENRKLKLLNGSFLFLSWSRVGFTLNSSYIFICNVSSFLKLFLVLELLLLRVPSPKLNFTQGKGS